MVCITSRRSAVVRWQSVAPSISIMTKLIGLYPGSWPEEKVFNTYSWAGQFYYVNGLIKSE